MKLVAPSILSADFGRLAEEIISVEKAGADWIHIDVMDGHFVPNITIGPGVVHALRGVTGLPFDVHLMIERPERYINAFADAGSDVITVHVEATHHLHRVVNRIRERGIKAGASLNPATPLSLVEPILGDIDLLLIMSVNPGFGGQTFIPASLGRIRQARELIDSLPCPPLIEVDGGVTIQNIREIAAAGTNIFVAGATIFGSNNYAKTIRAMKKAILDPATVARQQKSTTKFRRRQH
jgi:ribulose-phosphate 3-epimerase